MITLEELIKHRDCLDGIARGDRTTVEEAESVQLALSMLDALITQLENQSVALTF